MKAGAGQWESVFEEMLHLRSAAPDAPVSRSIRIGTASRLYLCNLWDGVYLWVNEIRENQIAYPKADINHRDFAVINLCLSGRCEVAMVGEHFVYMAPGLFNVNSAAPQSGYSYPGGSYEGIEVALDLTFLRENQPQALSDYGLTIAWLDRFLGAHDKNYMATLSEELEGRARSLFDALRAGSLSREEYRFRTLTLLHDAKSGGAREVCDAVLATRGQRRIAREVEQRLSADLGVHPTVEELALSYGISSSALKKYFAMVYGMPISRYMRRQRMERAKFLLLDGAASVGEIAGACGYEHPGKFGAAFKGYTGVSPMEFRRLHRGEGAG